MIKIVYPSCSRSFFAHSCCSSKECSFNGLWQILQRISPDSPDFGGGSVIILVTNLANLYKINIDICQICWLNNDTGSV